jgi:hypothetical protein
MGYRSDVAYVIAGKKEAIIAFLLVCKMDHPEVNLAIDECTIGRLEKGVLFIGFCASDVKWCPNYEDVKCHDVLWSLAQDQETLEGQKCIIGEDDNDITNDNFGGW